jgi:hypothetical protein
MSQKTGWSNDNQLQVSFQKVYHRGLAWNVMYDWQKNIRVGGNWSRDGQVYPYADFANTGLSSYSYAPVTVNGVTSIDMNSGLPVTPAMPVAPPSGTPNWGYYKALNRYENYGLVDTATPKQQLQYNYVVDLPLGRGKRFMGNANKLVNELVGGYQIAGDGNLYSSDFTITSTNWGPTNKIQYYKHSKPVTDCRSGNCYRVYQWWNGYVAPTSNAANSCSAQAGAKVLTGLSGDYATSTAYQGPMDQVCGTTSATNDPNYGNNNVGILFPGATAPGSIAYNPGPSNTNPFSHTVLNGPFNIVNDASLFKVFPITGKINVRFNMDVFNVFNNQGSVAPSGSDGTQNLNTTSNNAARQLQFTLRLTY